MSIHEQEPHSAAREPAAGSSTDDVASYLHATEMRSSAVVTYCKHHGFDTTAVLRRLLVLRRERDVADAQHAVTIEPGVAWPAPLDADALHGFVGDVVAIIGPQTEADPVALVVQLLVAFGSAVGRGPYFSVEADRHGMNLFAVIVGQTSKARKGTSWGHISSLLEEPPSAWRDPDRTWKKACVKSGLSSGEGLIWAVRDPTFDPKSHVSDPGVSDKRLLALEPEFAQVLRMIGREGNVLSTLVRQAWDTGDLEVLTKNSPARATGAHVSIIGHITKDEFKRSLTTTEAANGFANRFLFHCARRANVLPEGGRLSDAELSPLRIRLGHALTFASGVGEMRRDEEARALWHEVYPTLSEGRPGLAGSVTARAEAQVTRVACLYALLDMSSVVQVAHLRAALALWAHCEQSVRYIFGDSLGDPIADEILRALRQNLDGLTRTDIRNLFQRNKTTAVIAPALDILLEYGLASYTMEDTRGRPAERWRAL